MEPKFLFLLFLTFMCVTTVAQTTDASNLISCLVSAYVRNFTIATSLQTSSYYNFLDFSIRNSRFAGASIGKPVAIVLPSTKDQLRSAVVCCRNSSLAIRLRSGGHSYEGLSYTADGRNPFVVIDLMNLNRVRVNLTSSTAWVESGATLGDIYRTVAAEANGSLGFPAGSCATVGSGGHIGGGGFGFLGRKYGLAADNVLDAVLIDSDGRVLDRNSMGDDVFWAIRGGGGGSWGAVYAWQVRLVPVAKRITVFSLSWAKPSRFVAKLVHKWQYIAPNLPDEYYLSVFVSAGDNDTISVTFTGQFLGPSSQAIAILTRQFPELGLTESECTEMSWIETVVHFAGLNTRADLTARKSSTKSYFKAKSDYVRIPIPLTGLIGTFAWLAKEPSGYIILDPYGGAMSRIRSYDIPFPHRRGNLYGIQYMVQWTAEEDRESYKYMAWIRGFYEYMATYVSSNPRAAYVNYVDLDLGVDSQTGGGGRHRDLAAAARAWGEKYLLANYDRLVQAKTVIDPDNVFSNVQSIPPLVR